MSDCSPLRNPLILALDVDDEKRAWSLVEETGSLVGGIKIGPRLLLRFGPQFLKRVASVAPVFLDMKYFDIPSTMVSAVRSSFDIGASLVTVHAQAGRLALEGLAQLESEYQKTGPVRILAVTVLTSFDDAGLPSVLKKQSIEDHVLELAQLVSDSGLKGIVCSPHELGALKRYKDLYKVTPGIRTAPKPGEDQKRVMGPKEAMAAGSSALVIGRPILEAESPRALCESILKSMAP